MKLKKLLSGMFSIFIITVLLVTAYFNRAYIRHQVDKVKGMYYVHLGDVAYKKYNVRDAILYYNKGLSLYPKHYSAWHNLGNIYVEYEDYYSALHAYSQAFKYNPKMVIARMNYGIVSSELLGNFDDALKQYDKVISTKRKIISIPYVFNNKESSKDNRAIAYYNKGVTYRMKALYSTEDWELQRQYMSLAIRNYQQSIKINPNSYDAQYNLGTAYHISGDYERAGRCYCKAINLEPTSYEAHYNLAVLLYKLGHYQEAYEEIDKAITLITALDENSALLEYIANVMNEISREVYYNEDYKRKEKYRSVIALSDKNKTKKLNKNTKKEKKNSKKDNNSITSDGISFVNGKVVPTEELDKIIIEDFGSCPSLIYFEEEEKEI